MRLCVLALALAGCFNESRTDVSTIKCDGEDLTIKERQYYVGLIPESRTARELWVGDQPIQTMREPYPAWHPSIPTHVTEGPHEDMLHAVLPVPGVADPKASAACVLSHRLAVVDAMGRSRTPAAKIGMVVWTEPDPTSLSFGTDSRGLSVYNRGGYGNMRIRKINGSSKSFFGAGRVGKDPHGTVRVVFNTLFLDGLKPHEWTDDQGRTIEQVFGVKAEYLDREEAGMVFKPLPLEEGTSP